MKAEVLSRYSNALSRYNMRRAHKETMELCHDIEIIVATEPKTENKKIIATYDHSIATKNNANDKNTLSRHSNLCRDNRKEQSLNVHWDNVATLKLFVTTE